MAEAGDGEHSSRGVAKLAGQQLGVPTHQHGGSSRRKQNSSARRSAKVSPAHDEFEGLTTGFDDAHRSQAKTTMELLAAHAMSLGHGVIGDDLHAFEGDEVPPNWVHIAQSSRKTAEDFAALNESGTTHVSHVYSLANEPQRTMSPSPNATGSSPANKLFRGLAKKGIRANRAVTGMGHASQLGKIFGTAGKTLLESDHIDVTEPFMIHPTSRAKHIWDVFLSTFVIVTLFWTPFEIGFSYDARLDGDTMQAFWFFMDLLMLAFFVADIVVNFRTAIMDDGELVQRPRAVARIYARGWFIVDLIATIPYDWLLEGLFPNTFSGDSQALAWAQIPRFVRFLRLIRFMRMLRVLKLQKLVAHLQEIGAFASLVGRLGNIAFWVLLIAHVLGCGWFFIADVNGLEHNTWAYVANLHGHDVQLSTKYITSLYWAFVTVTTVGYGDMVPVNDSEKIYVIVCTFIGNSMFAYMIGKITSLASQMDASRAQYQEKMDAVNEFMRARALPRLLRKRIRKYYETFWSRGVYFKESDIVGELSFNIRRELAHFMNEDIIRNVPFFRDANDLFIDELLRYLRAEVCLPNDFIIREGDTGAKMYLLRKGAVAVIKDGELSHTLTRGAFFGEITLLFPSVRRTASVQALTECEMASLSKSDLEKVVEHYPDFLDMMSTVAKSHLKKDESAMSPVPSVSGAGSDVEDGPLQRRRRSVRRRPSITKSGAEPGWLSELKTYTDGVTVPDELMSDKMRRVSIGNGNGLDTASILQLGSAAQSRPGSRGSRSSRGSRTSRSSHDTAPGAGQGGSDSDAPLPMLRMPASMASLGPMTMPEPSKPLPDISTDARLAALETAMKVQKESLDEVLRLLRAQRSS